MKSGKFLIFIGLLLIAAALCLTGYNIRESDSAGKASDSALAELEPYISETHEFDPSQIIHPDDTSGENVPAKPDNLEYPDYVLDPTRPLPVKKIGVNSYVGIISLPAIGKRFPVFAQWSYSALKSAPCLFSGSPYTDNMVICAHNYRRHFGRIGNMSVGDEVTFTDMDGNLFRYEVSEILTIGASSVSQMTTATSWDLALFTCNMSGNARVTVRCVRK